MSVDRWAQSVTSAIAPGWLVTANVGLTLAWVLIVAVCATGMWFRRGPAAVLVLASDD